MTEYNKFIIELALNNLYNTVFNLKMYNCEVLSYGDFDISLNAIYDTADLLGVEIK